MTTNEKMNLINEKINNINDKILKNKKWKEVDYERINFRRNM